MRVLVASEMRLVQDPSGAVWSAAASGAFWDRYLAVFDEVVVVARLLQVEEPPQGWRRADRSQVRFHPLPHYLGPAQFVRRWWRIRRSVRGLVRPGDAVILRVASQVAAMLEPSLRRTGHPYGVEVVGDPWDVFAPGTIRHPLRPFLRRWFSRQLRRHVANAEAAAFVTETTLQRRYPPHPAAFTTHYSSIDLTPDAFVPRPRAVDRAERRRTLIFVGSVEQLYKAPDILLRALRICLDRGLDLDLDLVGGGRSLPNLKALVSDLDLTDRVRLHGEVTSGEPVRAMLDAADLFVLPSRTEGVPRAMIEAMARGLPCVGSTVGGIPELLEPDMLVPPDDGRALADRIERLITDPAAMASASERNLSRASDYAADTLSARRTALYRHLRAAVAARGGV